MLYNTYTAQDCTHNYVQNTKKEAYYMASVNVTIRLDEEVKKQFETFCDNVGLNITAAINMFIKATLRERVIPFSITDVGSFQVNPAHSSSRGRDNYGQY